MRTKEYIETQCIPMCGYSAYKECEAHGNVQSCKRSHTGKYTHRLNKPLRVLK